MSNKNYKPDFLVTSSVSTSGKFGTKSKKGAVYMTISKGFNEPSCNIAVEAEHNTGVGPFRQTVQHENALINIEFTDKQGNKLFWSGSAEKLKAHLFSKE